MEPDLSNLKNKQSQHTCFMLLKRIISSKARWLHISFSIFHGSSTSMVQICANHTAKHVHNVLIANTHNLPLKRMTWKASNHQALRGPQIHHQMCPYSPTSDLVATNARAVMLLYRTLPLLSDRVHRKTQQWKQK